MFTIEHDFDATVITLIDEGKTPLQEDVTVQAFSQVTMRIDQAKAISKLGILPSQVLQ